MSILVNELNRRFEAVDDTVDEVERKDIVEHFTTHLVNSGYGYAQSREIVLCSLKGIQRKFTLVPPTWIGLSDILCRSGT